MKTNLNEFDGYFRSLFFIISLIFAVLTGQWYWLIPTSILFVTAILTWCPAYAFADIIARWHHNTKSTMQKVNA